MSRLNTLRRTSLLLVTAAVAGLASSTAKANLTISLGIDGSYETTRNGHEYVFIDPASLPDITNTNNGELLLNVYATITGSQAVGGSSPAYANGLKYAYYGVTATSDNAGPNVTNAYTTGDAIPLMNQLTLVKNTQAGPLAAQSNTAPFTSYASQGGVAASAGYTAGNTVASGAVLLGGTGTLYGNNYANAANYVKASYSNASGGASSGSAYAAFGLTGATSVLTNPINSNTNNSISYETNTGNTTQFLIGQIPINIAALGYTNTGTDKPNASDFSVTLNPTVPTGNNTLPAAIWSEGTPVSKEGVQGLPSLATDTLAGQTTLHTPSATAVTGGNGVGGVEYQAGSYSASGSVTIETVDMAVENGDLLPGDTGFNGSVGFNELNDVLFNYGSVDQTWADGNFEYNPAVAGSDTIGFDDLNDVLFNYGSAGAIAAGVGAPSSLVASPSSAVAVPEPSMLSLAVVGAGLILGKRRSNKVAH